MLIVLFGWAYAFDSTLATFRPFGVRASLESSSRPGCIDVGRELEGVPFGVLDGVEDTLFTLAFRDPDLGVTLEFRKALIGVVASSFGVSFCLALATVRSTLPNSGDECVFGDPASRGAT